FHGSELLSRYQLLKDHENRFFVYYGDYWDFIEAWKNNLVFGEDGNLVDDLTPYYESYSNGFNEGYFEFEFEVKELNSIFQDSESITDKIFKETLTKVLTFSSRGQYYPSNNQKPFPIIKREYFFDGGKKAGRSYKAWYYIIHNYKPFISIFRDFYYKDLKKYEEIFNKRNPNTQNYKTSLQAIIDEIEKELGNSSNFSNYGREQGIENKFNQMPMNEVQDHFKPLTEKKNKKGEIWMTEEHFHNFLKRSFGGKMDLPKPKINIGNRGKFAVVKLFYLYYQKSISEDLQ